MESQQGLTENELVQQCIAGNRRCQEMLYKKYASKMHGVCVGYVNDRDDAKDILQEGFIKVFTSLHRFEGKGSLEGWIRKIIVRTAIDFYRRSVKEQHIVDINDIKNLRVEISILEKIQAKELLELIHKLPAGTRIIFNLYVIEGYTHNEIAEMLKISSGTSKSQYSRARSILQNWIVKLYSPDKINAPVKNI